MAVCITRPQVIFQMIVFLLVRFFKNYSFPSRHNWRQILVVYATLFVHVIAHVDPGNDAAICFIVELLLFDGWVAYDFFVHYGSFSDWAYVECLSHRVVVSVVGLVV